MPDTGWNDDALVRRIDMVDFLKEAEGIEQEVIGWRRHVHQYPELLMDLPETAAFVERELRNMGYEPEYICQSGIVAVLDSQKPGKTLLLRADMDALPIGEESGLEYASKHPGISHACGHDTHIAMLLGAAKLLMKHKDLLRGKVKFMFQPGEEGAHAPWWKQGCCVRRMWMHAWPSTRWWQGIMCLRELSDIPADP